MQVKIYGEGKKTDELIFKVKNVLEELGLSDFIKIEETNDDELKKELGIKEIPALIIEEESIDFKDIIFEGLIPEEDELKSMFTSIIGGGEMGDSCAPTDCGTCGTASICGV